MIHIFTALYYEAQIFIKQYQLIKNPENTCFQEFYNEAANIRLTITGVGEIAAAAAVSSAYTAHRPAPDDLLLNLGICAHTTQNDGIFLCNQIAEQATGKTFYPDMLYRHNFCEAAVVTEMLPWRGNSTAIPTKAPANLLHDMEAAAIYQAGAHFLGPHQMIFLKIVSDNGTLEKISGEQVLQLMEKYQEQVVAYIDLLSATTQEQKHRTNRLHSEAEELLETFCADLHCSKAMKDSMQQYIRYLSLSGIDYISIIQNMYQKGLLPCKDKREGKQRFDEFRQKIF